MTDLSGNGANDMPETEARGSLGVNAQYIKDLSFESPNVLKIISQPGGQPEVQFNLGVQANTVGPDLYEVTLTVRAEAKRDGMVAFIVELAYAGVFTITGIPQDQMEPVLFIEGPRLLFPFARAIIADLTRDGGFTPLMLNPIDFVDLYRRKLAERQAEGAPAGSLPN
ncbi:MAG TPA: protein-export chaperone SecB [Alphaproteobacteria bacterium]|jgi:preprotein translocase subunit SecB|nr:protein-export chaperone SecB [Alphaproteobacteria bacterium]